MGKGLVVKNGNSKKIVGKTMKIMKTPKKSSSKDSKFTKEVTLYHDQKDYFKMDSAYAKW